MKNHPQDQGRPPSGLFGGRVIRLGTLLGIRIGVDPSWFFIFVLVTYSVGVGFAEQHPSWSPIAVWIAAFSGSLLFFVSILLHELGHSVTAISLGLSVRSITLFLFGGVAELGGEAKRPRDEFLIAIAGPFVSALLAMLCGVIWLAMAEEQPMRVVCAWLAIVNTGVAVFNMLPGFPLDGGRVLRSFLWMATGSLERATQWSGRVGVILGNLIMALGLVMAISGRELMGGFFLAFMGWFLSRAARANVVQSILAGRLRSLTVGQAADLETPPVNGWDTLEDVVRRAPEASEGGVLVEEDGVAVGALGPSEFSATSPSKYAFHLARSLMTPIDGMPRVSSEATLLVALQAMDRENVSGVLVEKAGETVGLLTRGRLSRVLRAAAEPS